MAVKDVISCVRCKCVYVLFPVMKYDSVRINVLQKTAQSEFIHISYNQMTQLNSLYMKNNIPAVLPQSQTFHTGINPLINILFTYSRGV